MQSEWTGKQLRVAPDGAFDAAATLFCGQCFRWEQEADDRFRGVVRGRVVRLQTENGAVLLSGFPREETAFFLHYFAFDEDYRAAEAALRRSKKLAQCLDRCRGIRVLHQDFFEVLLSFIISQNNNIPRIRGIIERLCCRYGGELEEGLHSFVRPEALAGLNEEDLAFLRAGWRSRYLLDAARKVAGGEITEERLRELPAGEARRALMTIDGVGPKVADCTLLYGLGFADAFPVDVWVRRAMKRQFPQGLPRCAQPYAGLAQQVLFACERQQKTGNG